jgi:isopenicillin-N epimerase
MDRTWRSVCHRAGARYIQQPIPVPVTSQEQLAEAFWSRVTGRTRAVFVSHITSPTALVFPVAEICRRARAAGLLSIVDGAHAVSQVPLNLTELGADLYAGACHKWLCAPKGSAFLYARREVQPWLHPLVVSWGWGDDVIAPDPTMGETEFVRWHQWQGTRDIAAFLATPAAIQFQAEHNWDAVRAECHALASETRRRLNDLTGLAPLSPDSTDWFRQMAAVRLPPVDVKALQVRLYTEHRIEVPIFLWQAEALLRVSFQGYNTRADADALVEALVAVLPR